MRNTARRIRNTLAYSGIDNVKTHRYCYNRTIEFRNPGTPVGTPVGTPEPLIRRRLLRFWAKAGV